MASIFSLVADYITSKPYDLSKIILVLMVVSLFGATMVTMETGDDTYLDPNSKLGILNDHYKDVFQGENLILLIESGDSISPTLLDYIDSIEKPINNLQYIESVSSISDLIKSINHQVIPTSSGEMKEVLSNIPDNLQERYIPTGMLNLVPVILDPGLSDKQKSSALANLQKFIDSTDIPPGVSIKITGSAAFDEQMQSELGASLGILILAAMVLMVIVMGLLFGYVNHRFLPVVIIAAGLLFTFGFVGLAGIKISMAVIAAFPVLIGLGIDYAIQFHSRLEEEARDHPLKDAIRTTITKTGPAVLYAMIATCMGFVAMFLSPIPMLKTFGLVSIIGVFICYLTSLVGIPLFAMLLKYKAKGHGVSKQTVIVDSTLAKSAVWIAKRPIPILLVVMFIALIGLQLDPSIPVNTNQNAFVPPDMPAKVSLDKVTRNIGSTDTVPIIIRGSNVLSLDSIKWIKEFTDFELETESKITRSTSIIDYIIIYNNGEMPKTQSDLDTVLIKIPENIKDTYLNGNNEAVIQFNTVKLESNTKKDLKDSIEGDLQLFPPPPGIKADVTGSFAMFANLNTDIVESKDKITYFGFILVILFLALTYRNINAITPIVPIIAIIGWNAAVMYLMGLKSLLHNSSSNLKSSRIVNRKYFT